ncbi:hypothetical protein [Bdellovibrio sp. HCB2-146]|uniref:hypothetical protein n=1 Tax=Bdellovibrio sp. HCB2-146 TaxID=3394362 RepID=UPI0039BD4E8B
MKRVFGRIILCVTSLATVVSCSGNFDSTSESGNTKVLTYMPQSNGSYGFHPFVLVGVDDLKAVAGRFVNFMVAPRIIKQDGREIMSGPSPSARYVKSGDGTYVASDNFTLELFTIYAHMQRLAALDDELGAKGVNKWPRDIGVAVRVEGGLENNAQYYGPADAMFFVRYTKSNLPIAVNAGVLAHEHFHSLFYKLVKMTQPVRSSVHSLAELTKNTDAPVKIEEDDGIDFKVDTEPTENAAIKRDANEVYLRGLNEGFADFWGWMYTGDPDFVALSLPIAKERTLKVDGRQTDIPFAIETVKTRLSSLKEECADFASTQVKDCYDQYKLGFAYEVGTRYARLLKVFTEKIAQERKIENLEARKFVAKTLLKVLPKIDENNLGADVVVQLLARNTEGLKSSECEYLASVVNVISDKPWSCEENKVDTENSFFTLSESK